MGRLRMAVDLVEKEMVGLREVQVEQLRFLVVVAQEDQIDHEMEEEGPNWCWKVTAKRPMMCD